MNAVYYYDKARECCPVKKYLEQYANPNNSKSKQGNQNDKIIADIDAKIRHILQNNGKSNSPIYKPLSGYDYFEIKQRKNRGMLIRIFFFCHEDKMILLNAIEKPDNYNAGDKADRQLQRELEITQKYQNKFLSNTKLYEEYK